MYLDVPLANSGRPTSGKGPDRAASHTRNAAGPTAPVWRDKLDHGGWGFWVTQRRVCCCWTSWLAFPTALRGNPACAHSHSSRRLPKGPSPESVAPSQHHGVQAPRRPVRRACSCLSDRMVLHLVSGPITPHPLCEVAVGRQGLVLRSLSAARAGHPAFFPGGHVTEAGLHDEQLKAAADNLQRNIGFASLPQPSQSRKMPAYHTPAPR